MKKIWYPRFEGKVVWVIGASSGIGEQLCYLFDELGARLILSARNVRRLENVKANLQTGTQTAQILPLDLELLETLPSKAEVALGYFGRIDYLVLNAAVAIRDYVLATKFEIDQKLMKINYFGSVILTKCVLPAMLKNNEGHIVVSSSLSGKYGVPRTAAYAASKHALHGFFETLRSELNHPNIFITLVVPGIINTEITAHAYNGDGSAFNRVEKTYQTGYPVEKAAYDFIDAIFRRKPEQFVGGSEGLTLLINRFSPNLMRKIIRNHPIEYLRKLRRMISIRKQKSRIESV